MLDLACRQGGVRDPPFSLRRIAIVTGLTTSLLLTGWSWCKLLRPVTALKSGISREFHGTIIRQSIQFVFPWELVTEDEPKGLSAAGAGWSRKAPLMLVETPKP